MARRGRTLAAQDRLHRQLAADRAQRAAGALPPSFPTGLSDTVARRLAHRLSVRRLEAYSTHTLDRRAARDLARQLVDRALLTPAADTLAAARAARFADRVLDGIVRSAGRDALTAARAAWDLALASNDSHDQLRTDLESVTGTATC